MLAFLRGHSIRWQLIFTGIVILLILTAIVIWSYYRILDITYERNSVYTQEMIATIRNNIASNADTINRIMPNIAYNDVVQDYLKNSDPLARYELYLKLEKLLVNLKSMKQGILEIVLIGTNGNTYNCINCERDIPFKDIPERTTAFYMGIHPPPAGVPIQQRSTYSGDYVVYVGIPVYDTKATAGSQIGYLIMVLDVNAIAPQIDHMSQRIAGTFYVIDRNEMIYASNNAEDIGRPLPEYVKGFKSAFKGNGEKFVLHTAPLPEIDGKIISIFQVNELFRGLEDVQTLIIGIFILLISVLFLFYIIISRNILLPLRSFMSYIYSIRSKGLNQLSSRVAVEGYAEFSVMANHFNALLDEIDDLADKLIKSKTHIFELQLLKQQAELQFLKSQINPHFLYNTLETMKGIALVRGVQEIRDMSDALSRIFSYSIKGGDQVRLQEEIEIIEAYINIQQNRFTGRFIVHYEFSESSRNCKIIKMILQPLVENAIFHGIEPSMHKCHLVVGSRIDNNGDMLLWVKDDGVGMDPATLESIRQSLENEATTKNLNTSPQRHIGIINVHNRIRFEYGSKYGISAIQSALDEGTVVTIRIPVKGEVMYKALLVDDEKWILESLKRTVDWRGLGFEVVGEAMNGLEGFERIRDLRPDVAFIDIRMPGMNGIELIGKLKEVDVPAKFVVASGYAEFEYAKQAMIYGAVGYCLKPFRKEEIVETLIAVRETIRKERKALHNELMVLLQDSEVIVAELLKTLLHRLQFDWDERCGAFVVVVQGEGGELLPDEWGSLPLRIGSGTTAFLLHGAKREETVARLTEILPKHVRGVGVSELFHDIARIREHIDAAKVASYLFFVTGTSFLGVAGREQEICLDATVMKSMIDALKRKDLPAVRQGFVALESQFLAGKYDIRHAMQLYHVITVYIYGATESYGESIMTEGDKLTAVYDHVSGMIQGLLRLVIESFEEPGTDAADASGKETFSLIVRYIHEHFHDNLSIQDIAKQFYMHPNYLSSLFKKELRINFTKYLTDLRMQHAGELLRSTQLTVSDVAEQVGYNDYFYFAKMFKKHSGKTPTDYRTHGC